jgi:anti-sigma regulatory factor (Ser/Thr protein kinase)
VTGTGGGPGHGGAGGEVRRLRAALLPAGLPVLAEAVVAARYLPAPDDQAAGGGWFDAVVLPGGLVTLMAGEVAGGGVAAAAAAGQLRAVLTELLATDPDLAVALARADAFAARTPELSAAMLAVAVLDPAAGTLRYAVCGHPDPLIIAPDGRTWFLDDGRSGPLGTGSSPALAATALEQGGVVVLYSGGLAGQPGRIPVGAWNHLATVVADAVSNRTVPPRPEATAADRVCQLTAELAASAGHADDVTVLAAQRLPVPVPRLHLDLPAERASVGEARRGFAEWLAGAAPLADAQDALQLAVGEIVANAIEHAYPHGNGGSVEIDAEIRADGLLECRVADHGRWREPGHAEDRGNGLMLAAYLSGELVITHPPQSAATARGSRGTVVTLRRRLSRPAQLGRAAGTRAAAGPGPPFRVDIPAAGRAVVCGAAGSSIAERLAGRLLAACRGGAIALTADLTDVTHLGSAAVQVLFLVRDRLAAHHRDLALVAMPGSAAAAVLDRVCLPYASNGTG